jgi:hypothetical protein
VKPFELLLFAVDPVLVAAADRGGADAIVVDWERAGKHARQAGADTEINHHTQEDVRTVRALFPRTVVCRLNAVGPWTEEELNEAVEGGADEVLLPMVRNAEQVEWVLGLAAGRCGVGILVETEEAIAAAGELAELELARVYVGLNDLAIARGAPSIFSAVRDGTVERIRERFRAPFGFGGLTLPGRGSPVPSRLLAAELARLRCDFSFLRRSFARDSSGGPLAPELAQIRAMVAEAFARPAAGVERDRAELAGTIARLESDAATAEAAGG